MNSDLYTNPYAPMKNVVELSLKNNYGINEKTPKIINPVYRNWIEADLKYWKNRYYSDIYCWYSDSCGNGICKAYLHWKK